MEGRRERMGRGGGEGEGGKRYKLVEPAKLIQSQTLH